MLQLQLQLQSKCACCNNKNVVVVMMLVTSLNVLVDASRCIELVGCLVAISNTT